MSLGIEDHFKEPGMSRRRDVRVRFLITTAQTIRKCFHRQNTFHSCGQVANQLLAGDVPKNWRWVFAIRRTTPDHLLCFAVVVSLNKDVHPIKFNCTWESWFSMSLSLSLFLSHCWEFSLPPVSKCCRKHRNWTKNDWASVHFYDRSRSCHLNEGDN